MVEVTLEVDDEVYARFQRTAELLDKPVDEVISDWIEHCAVNEEKAPSERPRYPEKWNLRADK